MYVLDFSWGGPACNAIEFDRVHGQLARFNNHSKVFVANLHFSSFR